MLVSNGYLFYELGDLVGDFVISYTGFRESKYGL